MCFNFNEDMGYQNYKIYPVLYTEGDKYYYTFVSNVPVDSNFSFYHWRYSNQVYGRPYSVLETFDYQRDLQEKYQYEINLDYNNKLRFYIDNWAIMNPQTTYADLSLMLDIEKVENIPKIQQIINKNVF